MSRLPLFVPGTRRRQSGLGNRRLTLLTAAAQETVAAWLWGSQGLSSLEAKGGGVASLIGGGGSC